jgi:hypothetical protein
VAPDRIMTRARTILASWSAVIICLCGLLLPVLLTEPARCQDAVADPIGRARSALEDARSERAVRAFAPAHLDAAEQALERALAALLAEQPDIEIEHLAYLAERHATIAQLRARERKAEREVAALSAAYDLILEASLLDSHAARVPARSRAAPATQAAP